MRIAEAKIDLLFKYIGYLTDELNRSEVIDWDQYALRKQFLDDFDYTDPDEKAARMELEVLEEGDIIGVSAAQASAEAFDHTKRMASIRKEIATRIKHGE